MTSEETTFMMSSDTYVVIWQIHILGVSGKVLKVKSSQLQFQKFLVLEMFKIMLEHRILKVVLLHWKWTSWDWSHWIEIYCWGWSYKRLKENQTTSSVILETGPCSRSYVRGIWNSSSLLIVNESGILWHRRKLNDALLSPLSFMEVCDSKHWKTILTWANKQTSDQKAQYVNWNDNKSSVNRSHKYP